ncbi:AMIN-like domain-containing (lipo)protein [Paeniglutamicibacter cryotolerans]|uniref:AMIN-like domain-containing protein n=2 Tax=Paeniglutamicibacter cryotolerans TaxID=670079 RepID=A0A839QE39_9MICC|nr:hypothetical protein [Paeniglutamicibacter cryotolerans]
MNKALRAGIMSALLVAGLGIAPAVPAVSAPVPSAPASAPYCGITWGSGADHVTGTSSARISNVRAGEHTCYDRLVIDLKGKIKGYDVRYVKAVYTEGQGRKVPLAGTADLRIIVNAVAYDSAGHRTYNPKNNAKAVNVTGMRTFKQVAFLGSFEGQSSFGLGVRARLPFRSFVLAGPGAGSRLVIDVAHRW